MVVAIGLVGAERPRQAGSSLTALTEIWS